MDDIRDLRKKLKKAQQECARLREEKEHLKNLLQIPQGLSFCFRSENWSE